MIPIELGWSIQGNTGWGLYAMHLALGLARQGRRVHANSADWDGIAMTIRPSLAAMQDPGDTSEYRIRFDPWGNHCPAFVDVPNRYRVLLAVFEDTEAIDAEIMGKYDLILAPSCWVQGLLAAQGVESTLFHQGYDDSLFRPAPKRRTDGRFMVFSGGKLEFRKGQDIVVDAFRQFMATPKGKDAMLVTAWQNKWPGTMEGIWASGYVKGVPAMRGNQLDISGWLEINGIPRDRHMDVGLVSQAEMANAIRECDVAVFPNRAEGATNLALVEALGCGIPSIRSKNTGHADVPVGGWLTLAEQTPVTVGCSLYRGMDGWGESDPADIADLLTCTRTAGVAVNGHDVALEWSWDIQTDDLNTILTERVDGKA